MAKIEKEKPNVWDILRKHFPFNEYALMAEVRDAAGYGASNSADFIVVNLWPSRGLHINGIELKSYRSDWLKEKKNPKKAENILRYCDKFWLLTTDDTIAKIEEIPDTWGWMTIKGSKITVVKDAPLLACHPVSRDFLATMLKRACDKTQFVHISAIEDRVIDARQSGRNEAKNEIASMEKELKEKSDIIHQFYMASGINLAERRWDKDYTVKTGAAVKIILDGGAESIRKDIIRLESTASMILKRIQEHVKTLDGLKP